MKIVPIFRQQAREFIGRYHRHNLPSISSIFNLALENEGKIIGVAMCGLPKARMLMDGLTLEVTRVCVLEGNRNANSMLYGACARAAAALGYERLVTYTLETESGASLRGAGWKRDETPRTHSVKGWGTNGKAPTDLFGTERIPQGPKVRWWKKVNR